MDPKRLVARGYDEMHGRYAKWGGGHGGRRHQAIDTVVDVGYVQPGDRALDLGCGTGELATAYLVQRGLRVTGVDISAASIATAKTVVPQATFIIADMATAQFPDHSFNLIAAFYSIIHVPREEHAALFARIARWLRPGGVFVATLGASHATTMAKDWLGVPMYWSHFDSDTTTDLIGQAGLDILSTSIDTEIEDGVSVSFLALSAQRPADGK